MAIPTTLYHYTSVDSLALVLKNRTLRFSSLRRLDDLVESRVHDLEAVSRLCYVSSWTAESDESIPMWREYASVSSGVRLALPCDPFRWMLDVGEGVPEALSMAESGYVRGSLRTRLTLAGQIHQGVVCVTAAAPSILYEVQYTDDESLLVPAVWRQDSQVDEYRLGDLGKYKPRAWSYQKEWRYILLAYPSEVLRTIENPGLYLSRMQGMMHGALALEMPDYLDLDLDGAAMSRLEITLAPKLTAGNRVIVEDLVEKYCPGATVRDSSIELA